MKSYREQFVEHYIKVEEPYDNKKGYKTKYVYCGPWYMWNVAPHMLIRKKCTLGVAGAINLFLFILCAVQYADVNRALLVETPATLSVIALIFEALGIVQFCAAKSRITESSFQDIGMKLRIAPLAHALLLFLTAAFGIYYLLYVAFTRVSLFVLTGFVVCAGLSLFIYREYRSLPHRSEKNTIRKELLSQENELPEQVV